jgi:hypothetical protein
VVCWKWTMIEFLSKQALNTVARKY